MKIRPLIIDFPQAKIDDIFRRIRSFDWAGMAAAEGWSNGTDVAFLRDLTQYWVETYDWRASIKDIGRFHHQLATIDGIDLHFIRSKTARTSQVPLVLIHGWPGSFFDFLKIADRLGDDDGEVVIISIPGFPFSGRPPAPIGPRLIANLIDKLMVQGLGYQRYLAHGGDWGSIIATRLGHEHADHCAGIHLTMVSARLVAAHAASEEDKAWLSAFMTRFEDDGGYFRLQSTRPQTIGYALQDSPVGFAAWLVEKYAAWADVARDAAGRPDLFSAISRDELLTSIMLFLATDSVATSTWIYRGFARENPVALPPGERVNVPVAVTAFADKAFPITPRGLVEKVYNVVDWSVKDSGGHFPALEVPDLLAAELRRFMKNYAPLP
ncbi:hypothetical protein UP09_08500 [Bradyrhizobium sp. LTSP885]|uniref:epoxide hydrolase family protein n=1 Tax=Bradyrhizobium sp. LTSP885 TaxID=1619232 RepID=UPI0005C7EA7F|nr:epoxide hydrolase [Bradyrhizobium sp. LTSP885]KJC48755.1 hypothetical protein UP09_08500 [Bradyrhizobium sp. LTSP885]